MRLHELAAFLEARYEGEADYEVSGIAALEKAQAQHLSFVASEKYLKQLAKTAAGIVVLSPALNEHFSGNKILIDNPYLAYARLSALFATRVQQVEGIHPTATVADTATIGDKVSIGPNCVVAEGAVIGANCELYAGCYVGERVEIGDDCLLYPNVTLYHDVKLGSQCLIHSGTVIGSDGFGFAPTAGAWTKIHQIGSVHIGNKVEIGSNCSIDRGALENTLIADNVIIDNLVHIAHNVQIGEGTAIAGCVGIAGSAVIGKNCTVAGMVAINGHIEIADNTHFHGGTIVTRGNREGGQFASTAPMMPVKDWQKNSVRYRQLEKWVERIQALEKAQKQNDK